MHCAIYVSLKVFTDDFLKVVMVLDHAAGGADERQGGRWSAAVHGNGGRAAGYAR